MNTQFKKNYYEMLGLRREASGREIEEGYNRTRRLYSDESDAIYSLYTEDERKDLLAYIDQAYLALIDPEKRKGYDKMLNDLTAADGTYEVDLASVMGARKVQFQQHRSASQAFSGCKTARFSKAIVSTDPAEAVAAEQYKVLAAKLEMAVKDGKKALAFTSAVSGEGKSSTSLNAAYLLATTFGMKTIFAECDLRKPSTLAAFIEPANEAGLSDVLGGRSRLEDAVCRVEETNLYIIGSGVRGKSSPGIIDAAGMGEVIERLKRDFDCILLDCPPVIPLADMSIMEKLADGMVLVVRAGRTTRDLVSSAIESIGKGRFVGAVLNGAETKLEKYYY